MLKPKLALSYMRDYFQMTSYQGSGSSANITPDDELTYFGGFLVKKT